MDFSFTREDEAFREEVASFVERELPWDWRERSVDPEEPEDAILVKQFKKKLSENGWLTMAWPQEYGGQAAPHIKQVVFNEEMAYRGVPAGDAGVRMVGPILMLYGTEEQKRYFLPRIGQADIDWAQGYSEPDAGSDLASLQTRAVEDGDDFVVTGSKIWNGAHAGADWMFMLARTDPDAPKHRGISVFIVDMDTPGIEVRPILNMFDVHYFNQVFFDNVRVPKSNMIGERDRGWYVAATSLDFERSGVGRFASNQRSLEELIQVAKETEVGGRTLSGDPVIRHRLAELWTANEAGRAVAYNVAWMQSQGEVPNKEASASKLLGSEIAQRIHGLGVQMARMYGILDKGSKWAPLNGRLAREWMDSISFTIRAGTSEIQRNIIATRGLGLPRG